jgi:hypothetical protein
MENILKNLGIGWGKNASYTQFKNALVVMHTRSSFVLNRLTLQVSLKNLVGRGWYALSPYPHAL